MEQYGRQCDSAGEVFHDSDSVGGNIIVAWDSESRHAGGYWDELHPNV
jgi:hypothetical protein